jgi:hypothetical protein
MKSLRKIKSPAALATLGAFCVPEPFGGAGGSGLVVLSKVPRRVERCLNRFGSVIPLVLTPIMSRQIPAENVRPFYAAPNSQCRILPTAIGGTMGEACTHSVGLRFGLCETPATVRVATGGQVLCPSLRPIDCRRNAELPSTDFADFLRLYRDFLAIHRCFFPACFRLVSARFSRYSTTVVVLWEAASYHGHNH